MNDPQQPYGPPEQQPGPGPYTGHPSPQAHEQPSYGQPSYGQTPHGQGYAPQQSYDAPAQQPYGQESYSQAAQGQTPHAQGYGGQAAYDQASYGQASHGQPSDGQPSYGQAQASYDHASYGQQPAPQQQYAPQQPQDRYAAQQQYGQEHGQAHPGPGRPSYGQAQAAPYGQPQAAQAPHGQAPAAAPHAPATSTTTVPAPGGAETGTPQGAPQPDAPQDLSRLAPNQRARAEGRSPIIAPGMQPAALTAVLALLLGLTSALFLPEAVRAVPVVLLQAVTAAGWFRLNGMWPARQGIALAFLAGVTTDVALLATDRADAPLVVLGTLGVWCLLVLVLQLRNRSSADERMYALTAGLTSTALTVLAAGQLSATSDAVVVGAAAVAAAVLVRALPLPGPVAAILALLAATGAGAGAGLLGALGIAGALLGLAAGGCALIGLRVASYDYPSRFVHLTAGVALPLALAAPAVHLLGPLLS
ncbi:MULTISPECIES: hypothetical protein [Streptomyces]|uniref:Integral membrane protein n=1 Tax=Streptomyces ramulosus TaxID=47762 RepID=A0ABW1FH02_9ACTN